MSRTVRVRRRAELDLTAAASWYEEQRLGLGARFTDELLRLVASVADNALLYPQCFGATRRAVARRFPYAVYFQLHGDYVVILRVLHMRRNRTGS